MQKEVASCIGYSKLEWMSIVQTMLGVMFAVSLAILILSASGKKEDSLDFLN